MPHEVFVRDLVAIERKVVLPDHCPRCKASFEPGSKNVKLWALRPMFHQVRLTKVITNGVKEDVFETTGTTQVSKQELEWERLPAIFKCDSCGHTLAKYHHRTWILEALDREMAGKLRTLLYDSNVLDQEIKKKVWNADYSSSCFACDVEAELGTEEVPHPIDARVHTCTRNKDAE